MSRARAGWACAALLSMACGRELPDPRILGISPARIVQGTAPPVLIDLEAVLPFSADYDAEDLRIETGLLATLGGLSLRNPGLDGNGDVIGFAPFDLPTGVHDARVDLADGRAAVMPAAVTVEEGPFPNSYAVDPIATQAQGQPFTIFIRAIGGQAADFAGVVKISSRGSIAPEFSGPFVAGERAESVTISSPGTGLTIRVEDAVGHFGVSNPFAVN